MQNFLWRAYANYLPRLIAYKKYPSWRLLWFFSCYRRFGTCFHIMPSSKRLLATCMPSLPICSSREFQVLDQGCFQQDWWPPTQPDSYDSLVDLKRQKCINLEGILAIFFSNPIFSVHFALLRGCNLAKASINPVTSTQFSSWSKPPRGLLKCNTDATWKPDWNRLGTGWVLRDEQGCFIRACCKGMPRPPDPRIKEALSSKEALP